VPTPAILWCLVPLVQMLSHMPVSGACIGP
jgi:hypothetical protein